MSRHGAPDNQRVDNRRDSPVDRLPMLHSAGGLFSFACHNSELVLVLGQGYLEEKDQILKTFDYFKRANC